MQRVQYELSFEHIDQDPDSPQRHVQTTSILRPTSVMRPLVVRCHDTVCAAGGADANASADGWDILPTIAEMLANLESIREGDIDCVTDPDQSCSVNIRYRVTCHYDPM